MAKSVAFLIVDDDVSFFEAHKCDSATHSVLATKRLFWPTGPVEYCDECAAWMMRIGHAMGVHVHFEPIPPPTELLRSADARRAINLDGP